MSSIFSNLLADRFAPKSLHKEYFREESIYLININHIYHFTMTTMNMNKHKKHIKHIKKHEEFTLLVTTG